MMDASGGELYLQDELHEFCTALDENALDEDPIQCARTLNNSLCYKAKNVVSMKAEDEDTAPEDLEQEKSFPIALYQYLRTGLSIFSDLRYYFAAPSHIMFSFADRFCSVYAWKAITFKTTQHTHYLIVLTVNWLRLVDISWSMDIESTLDDLEKSERVSTDQPETGSRELQWCLGYSDPYPKWRCLASHGSDLDDLIVAIGYSTGKIELIWLNVACTSANKPSGRFELHTTLSAHANPDPSTSLNPLSMITFLDEKHLVVCHFSGEIDVWLFEKCASTYPVRLMKRFASQRPITTGLLDRKTKTLIVGGMGERSNDFTRVYGLASFKVASVSPFIMPVRLTNPSGTNSPSRRLLGKFLRPNPMLGTISEADCVMKLLVTGAHLLVLHCTGAISVWALPLSEPTLLMPKGDESFPLDISIWQATQETGRIPLIAVVRESGNLSILDLNSLTERHMDNTYAPSSASVEFVDHHVRFKPRASFIQSDDLDGAIVFNWIQGENADEGRKNLSRRRRRKKPLSLPMSILYYMFLCANEALRVLGIDGGTYLQSFTPTAVSKQLELRSASYHEQLLTDYRASVIRISPTTPSGLFSRQLRAGNFQMALNLARQHGLCQETVFKFRWLSRFVKRNLSNPTECIGAIEQDLRCITRSPHWLLQECLDRLPNEVAGWEVSDVLRFAGCLAEFASDSLSQLAVNVEARAEIRERLLNIADHVETVRLMDVAQPLNAEGAVQMLFWLRHNSLLSLATQLCHHERFEHVAVLVERYPRVVIPHVLAILASLPEVLPPEHYVRSVLAKLIVGQVQSERLVFGDMHADKSNVDQLYDSLPRFYEQFQDRAALTPQDLACWLLHRAREIDRLSGLTQNATQLLCSCYELCLEAWAEQSQLQEKLDEMEDLLHQFRQLERILYGLKPSVFTSRMFAAVYQLTDETAEPTTETVMLDRLDVDSFMRLTDSQKMDLALHLFVGQESPLDQTMVLHAFTKQVLPFVAIVPDRTRRSAMIETALLQLARRFGLSFHLFLIQNVTAPTKDNFLTRFSPPVTFYPGQLEEDNKFVSDLLSGGAFVEYLVFVLKNHHPTELTDVPAIRDYFGTAAAIVRHMTSSQSSLPAHTPEVKLLGACADAAVDLLDLLMEHEVLKQENPGFHCLSQLLELCLGKREKCLQELIALWLRHSSKLFASMQRNALVAASTTASKTLLGGKVKRAPEPSLIRRQFIDRFVDVLERLFLRADDLKGNEDEKVHQKFQLARLLTMLMSSDEAFITLAGESRAPLAKLAWLKCLLVATRHYAGASVPLQRDDRNCRLARLCLNLQPADAEAEVAECEAALGLLCQLFVEQDLLELRNHLLSMDNHLGAERKLLTNTVFTKTITELRRCWNSPVELLNYFRDYLRVTLAGLMTENRRLTTESPLHSANLISHSRFFHVSASEAPKVYLQVVLDIASSRLDLLRLASETTAYVVFVQARKELERVIAKPASLDPCWAKIIGRLIGGERRLLYALFAEFYQNDDQIEINLPIERFRMKLAAAAMRTVHIPAGIFEALCESSELISHHLASDSCDNNSWISSFYASNTDVPFECDFYSSGKMPRLLWDNSLLPASLEDWGSAVKTHLSRDNMQAFALAFGPAGPRKGWLRLLGEKLDNHQGLREELDRLAAICLAQGASSSLDPLCLDVGLEQTLTALCQKHGVIQAWKERADSNALMQVLVNRDANLDLKLFEADQDYRSATILGLSMTDPSLGLKLAARHGVPKEHVLAARLEHLVCDSPLTVETRQQFEMTLGGFLATLTRQFSSQQLVDQFATSVFPSLSQSSVFRVQTVLRVIAQQLGDSASSVRLQDIPLSVHLSVLQLLMGQPRFANKVSYASFSTDRLSDLVSNESDARILARVVELLSPYKPELKPHLVGIRVGLAHSLLKEAVTFPGDSAEVELFMDRAVSTLMQMPADELSDWLETRFLMEEFVAERPESVLTMKRRLLTTLQELLQHQPAMQATAERLQFWALRCRNLTDAWEEIACRLALNEPADDSELRQIWHRMLRLHGPDAIHHFIERCLFHLSMQLPKADQHIRLLILVKQICAIFEVALIKVFKSDLNQSEIYGVFAKCLDACFFESRWCTHLPEATAIGKSMLTVILRSAEHLGDDPDHLFWAYACSYNALRRRFGDDVPPAARNAATFRRSAKLLLERFDCHTDQLDIDELSLESLFASIQSSIDNAPTALEICACVAEIYLLVSATAAADPQQATKLWIEFSRLALQHQVPPEELLFRWEPEQHPPPQFCRAVAEIFSEDVQTLWSALLLSLDSTPFVERWNMCLEIPSQLKLHARACLSFACHHTDVLCETVYPSDAFKLILAAGLKELPLAEDPEAVVHHLASGLRNHNRWLDAASVLQSLHPERRNLQTMLSEILSL